MKGKVVDFGFQNLWIFSRNLELGKQMVVLHRGGRHRHQKCLCTHKLLLVCMRIMRIRDGVDFEDFEEIDKNRYLTGSLWDALKPLLASRRREKLVEKKVGNVHWHLWIGIAWNGLVRAARLSARRPLFANFWIRLQINWKVSHYRSYTQLILFKIIVRQGKTWIFKTLSHWFAQAPLLVGEHLAWLPASLSMLHVQHNFKIFTLVTFVSNRKI